MAEPADKLKVFVSYAREDLAFADQLVDALRVAGFEPLIDRHRMTGGEEFKARLGALILECDTVVFVVSADSVDPQSFCAWEISETDRLSKRMIPVIPHALDSTVVPERLRNLDYIFFYPEPNVPNSGFGNGLARLATALNSNLGWLREHTTLGERAARWDLRGRDTDSLLRGKLLADAERWQADRPVNAPEITATQRAYLDASRLAENNVAAAERARLADMQAAQDARAKALAETEEAQRQREEAQQARDVERAAREASELKAARRQKAYTASAVVVAMILAGMTYFLWDRMRAAKAAEDAATNSAKIAEARSKETEIEKENAKKALRKERLQQSRYLEAKAQEAMGKKDFSTAALLAIAGLPDKDSGIERPRLPKLASLMSDAVEQNLEVNVLAGHRQAVRDAQFSPDGGTIVTASDDKTARLWQAATGTQIAALEGHGGKVLSAEFSPDGKNVITASEDNSARIWDVATHTQVAVLQGHTDAVNSAVYSRDGNLIVTASRDKTARLWDAKIYTQVATIAGNDSPLLKATFSPDGQTVATVSKDGIVGLWTAATGEKKELFDPRTTGPTDIKTAGELSISRSEPPNILIESSSGKRTFYSPEAGLDFSPDGALLVETYQKSAILWELGVSREATRFGGSNDSISSARFSPDGKEILTASSDDTAHIWSAETQSELTVFSGHRNAVHDAAFSPDGKTVVTASRDGTARIWRKRAVDRGDDIDVAEAKLQVSRCLTPDQLTSFALDDTAAAAWCSKMKKWPYQAGDAQMAVYEKEDDRQVLIAHADIGFGADKDLIRVQQQIGKFDRIRLRVLDSHIHLNTVTIVYDNGKSADIVIDGDVPQNSRTGWIDVDGAAFITEVQLSYRSRPGFKGRARVEIVGQQTSDWLTEGGEGPKYNSGWVLLGAETVSFVGFDSEPISVGRNAGGFRRLRLTVRDRSVSLRQIRVLYADGTTEEFPLALIRVAAGETFGPLDLKSGKSAAIARGDARIRSRFFDSSAAGRGAAVLEIWGQH